MTEFGVHEAKTHFSKRLERALSGAEVVITRSGTPLVTTVPVQRRKKPNPGFAAGTGVVMADDFDELPEWFVAFFE